ncbi:hypothetical protein F2S73_13750, partial [Pseudomonas syringae pv. actinidiae]|nr:hypothetical protein [Pseudomonas syringae pv. actinidiae]
MKSVLNALHAKNASRAHLREERQPRAEQAAVAVSEEEEVLLNDEQANDDNQD